MDTKNIFVFAINKWFPVFKVFTAQNIILQQKNDRFCTYRMHKICINLRKYNDVPMSNSIYFMFG